MKTTNTTTTTAAAVLLLPQTCATTKARFAARTKAAHARHNPEGPTAVCIEWYSTPYGLTFSPAEIQFTAERSTYYSLKSRRGTAPLFDELLNSWAQDRTAAAAVYMTEEAAEAEAAHDAARAKAESLQAEANRISTTAARAFEAARLAADYREEAAAELEERQSLEKAAAHATYSDRMDIVQAAAAMVFDALTRYDCTKAAAAWNAERDTPHPYPLRAMLTHLGCMAAQKAISQLAHPDAMTATRTKRLPITEREYLAHIATFGAPDAHAPHPVKGGGSVCYDTVEYRTGETATRTQSGQARKSPIAVGYYRISHYATFAPYTSYEAYTTDADGNPLEAVLKSYSPFVQNQGATEKLEALATRAELTERERIFCAYLATAGNGATATGRAADAARRAYFSNHREKAEALRRNAEAAAAQAAIDKAFHLCGILSADARRQFLSRLRKAVKKAAASPAAEVLTEAEAAALREEQKHKAAAAAMRDPRRGDASPAAARDWLAWKTAAPAHDAAVNWIPYTTAREYISTEERAAEEAAARAAARKAQTGRNNNAARRAEYRRYIAGLQTPAQYLHRTETLNAAAAALVFWDAMTPAQQTRTLNEAAAAKGKALAKLAKEAEAHKAETAKALAAARAAAPAVTVKQFNAMTAEARRAYRNKYGCYPVIKEKTK